MGIATAKKGSGITGIHHTNGYKGLDERSGGKVPEVGYTEKYMIG
jgi:hypothetical protein